MSTPGKAPMWRGGKAQTSQRIWGSPWESQTSRISLAGAAPPATVPSMAPLEISAPSLPTNSSATQSTYTSKMMAIQGLTSTYMTLQQRKRPFWWRMLICEFLASFFYIFIISLLVAQGVTALTYGIVSASLLLGLYVVLGRESGAHVSPAVTLGLCVMGEFEWTLGLAYMLLAQPLGAITGTALTMAFVDATTGYGAPSFGVGFSAIIVFLAEMMGTFIWLSVLYWMHKLRTPGIIPAAVYADACGQGYSVDNMAKTVLHDQWSVYAPFLALLAAHITMAPISGGAFNWYRHIWGVVFASLSLVQTWVYLVGPLAGALIAALVVICYFLWMPPAGDQYMKSDEFSIPSE